MKKVHRKGQRRSDKPEPNSAKPVANLSAKIPVVAPASSPTKTFTKRPTGIVPPARPGQATEAKKEDDRRFRFSTNLVVLYEDDAVIVLNKSAGMLAVPIPGSATPSAWSMLSERLERKRQKALIVHRIDRFSSGALLFAKTAPDRHHLVRQFLAHTPVRQYLAVVRGRLGDDPGESKVREWKTLVQYFERSGMYQQLRSAKDPGASRAELRYSVERLFENASLVRVELVTGLQNQIRVQFAALQHPIIGDRKYRQAEAAEPLIDRVALHAAHLEFVHPRSGQTVKVDCKLPSDFERLIRGLGKSQPAAVATRETAFVKKLKLRR